MSRKERRNPSSRLFVESLERRLLLTCSSASSSVLELPADMQDEIVTVGSSQCFSVAANAGDELNVRLQVSTPFGPVTGQALHHGEITLYDIDGITPLQTQEAGGGESPIVDVVWVAQNSGDFLVEVRDVGNNDVGSFGLTAVSAVADDYGNWPATATSVVATRSDSPATGIAGTIGDFDDVDVFVLDTVPGRIYNAYAVWEGEPNNIFVETPKVDVSGWTLSYWMAPADQPTNTITVTGNSSFGDYRLHVEEIIYSDDHSNLPQMATATSVGSTVVGEIEVLLDRDYFAFDVFAGEEYRIFADEVVSTRIAVTDLNGWVVNASFASPDFVTFTAATTGTVYASVEASTFDFGGPYQLTIAEGGDDHGDTGSAATPLVLGGTPVGGQIDFGADHDVFSLDAVAGTIYRFDVAGEAGDEPPSVLLNRPFGIGKLFTPPAAGDLEGYWLAWNDGPHFLSLFDNGVTDPGAYSIQAEVPDYGDDHGNLASLATPVAVNVPTVGNIEVRPDIDYFSFVAVAGTTYNVKTTSDDMSTVLRVYGQNGTTQLEILSGDFITWTAPDDGTYFVRVDAGFWDGFGSYELLVEIPGDDHGNSASSATPAQVAVDTLGVLESDVDVDFFSFSATAGTLYDFSATNARMKVFAQDGSEELASFTHGGRWLAPESGTYFVSVDEGLGISEYTLLIEPVAYTDDHGNTAASAIAVAVGASADGDIEIPGDVDFFSFNAVAGEGYNISTSTGTIDDTFLRLYDTDGLTELASNDSGGLLQASLISWTAPTSGTYFARVEEHGADRIGTYQLGIEGASDDHGDTHTAATPLTVGTNVTASINVQTDVDYFSFQAVAGTFYNITGSRVGNSNAFPAWRLLATDGVTPLLTLGTRWLAPASGSYFVSVEDLGTNNVGEYSLLVDELAYEDDHGNLWSTATPLNGDSSVAGEIEIGADLDFVSFDAVAGVEYTIYTESSVGLDTALRVFDTTGTRELAFDNDGGVGFASRIVWTAPSTGAYFLRVQENGFNATGTYELHVESTVVRLPCDYVGTESGCDIDDLDALYAGESGAPTPLSDSLISQWLADASSAANPSKANPGDTYVHGDVNLDGNVNSVDLGLLLNNFNGTNAGWSQGNFNSDPVVDSTDLGLLLNNFNFNSDDEEDE